MQDLLTKQTLHKRVERYFAPCLKLKKKDYANQINLYI